MNCGKYPDADKAKRGGEKGMDLADQFVVGGAVGLSLAWRAAFSHPEAIELVHERFDDSRIVGKDARLEIASMFGFGAHAGAR